MTAQQQLAELNAAIVEHCGPGSGSLASVKASSIAFRLIRDHGPAIAGLIEAASVWPRYDGDRNRYVAKDCATGFDQVFDSLAAADAHILDRVRGIAAGLRKLTQDATP